MQLVEALEHFRSKLLAKEVLSPIATDRAYTVQPLVYDALPLGVVNLICTFISLNCFERFESVSGSVG